MSSSPKRQIAPAAPLRVAGHFGELMQGRLGPAGPLALISLPCPALWVDCVPGIAAQEPLIGPRRIAALCAALSLPVPDPCPALFATMPVGGGAGSSTAGLVALARALGFAGSPEDLAAACAHAEGASDPLMFAHAERLLFAPRAGRVLDHLPALPRFEVLGGFLGPVQRTDPADLAFPDIADLVAEWRRGLTLPAMAALSADSARRTLDMRGPKADPTAALARELGALGWLIAHTGNARGLIFAPGAVPADGERALHEAGFAQLVRFGAGGAA